MISTYTFRLNEKEYKYVGFLERLFCVFLDNFLIFFLVYFALIPLDIFINEAMPKKIIIMFAIISLWITIYLSLLYYLSFWLFHSSTPGKMVSSARIVDSKTFAPPKKYQLLIRYFGYLISAIFGLGYLWIIFDKKKQGFHDKLAGTVVIRPAHIYSQKIAALKGKLEEKFSYGRQQ